MGSENFCAKEALKMGLLTLVAAATTFSAVTNYQVKGLLTNGAAPAQAQAEAPAVAPASPSRSPSGSPAAPYRSQRTRGRRPQTGRRRRNRCPWDRGRP